MAQLKSRNASPETTAQPKSQPLKTPADTAQAVTPKPRGGRPTKEAVLALERRILDVAARLFGAQGFAATTMEQVASDCQAGKDTLYRRYPSKTALFEALISRARREVLPELERIAAAPGTPLQVLRGYARALLAVNMRPELAALNRVALSEAVPMGGVRETPAAEDQIMVMFAALVAAAQDDGALSAGDPLEIAEQLLYATSIKPLLSVMMGQQTFLDSAAQDAYFEMAWTLALRGAAAA
ncbi:TetR/AcrR family transcriptional regulator [Phaeobacter sp. B1627]|uniref:TetR/AcrR family transcriptional regulator n=1 Tax=Phaeobacter sp. B1627 TaxID=2583809 RepID=UPI00111A4007|nr:TetR/AcrR family transcriptional regulator [Phaeobacter sp. B1627]TNJ43301.1 TetR/AcrR family transcriptional regulator [Phaeobacter sp. B1627]